MSLCLSWLSSGTKLHGWGCGESVYLWWFNFCRLTSHRPPVANNVSTFRHVNICFLYMHSCIAYLHLPHWCNVCIDAVILHPSTLHIIPIVRKLYGVLSSCMSHWSRCTLAHCEVIKKRIESIVLRISISIRNRW